MNERMRLKGEQGFFVILGLISVFFSLVSLKMFLTAPTISGEGTVPLLCCIVMLVTTAMSIMELRGYPRAFQKGVPLVEKAKETLRYLFPGKVGIITLYCVLYGVILNLVGFAISTFVFLVGSMLTLSAGKKLRNVLVSLITTVAIIVLFQYIFRVQLP